MGVSSTLALHLEAPIFLFRNRPYYGSWEFHQEWKWLPIRLICKRFPVMAHSPWKITFLTGCSVSRMELFSSLESQMSSEKKESLCLAHLGTTIWSLFISAYLFLMLSLSFPFSFLFIVPLVLFQLLIASLLMFSQTKHPLCYCQILALDFAMPSFNTLCFLDKYEEAVWIFLLVLFIILKQQLRHQPELSCALLETKPSSSAFPIIELLKLDVISVSMQYNPLIAISSYLRSDNQS